MGIIALWVTSIILGLSGFFSFLLAYRQHKEKGFIFTNTWLFASENERKNMDVRIKKYEYRVARNIFFMIGVLFSLIAIDMQLIDSRLSYLIWAITGIIVIVLIAYAIVQFIMGERLRVSIEAEKKTIIH
jgi:hypothetical protein